MKIFRKNRFLIPVFLVLSMFILHGLMAASKGKLTGTVRDVATGEPLAGANIMIVGSMMGAATDAEGTYFILNVPPGVYDVRAQMMGYAELTISGVRVNVDRTIVVDFDMKTAVVEGETITVTAKREQIKQDVSSTETIVLPEQIQDAPVTRTEELIGLTAGVRFQDDADAVGFVIRGGEVSETGFTIDGISMMDDRVQSPYISISRSAVQEVQILTGGFSAKYGNIRSGLINIVTKEGDDRFHGSFEYGHQPPQQKHFGPSAFSPESNLFQTFAYGPEENVFGGWSAEESPIGIAWMGWNEYSQRSLEDDDPYNDVTPQEGLEIWKWLHRGYEYAKIPDTYIDASLGGPLPFGMYFFSTFVYDKSWLAYPLARDYYQNYSGSLKLTWPASPSLKFTLQGIIGKEVGNKEGWLDNGIIRSPQAAAGNAWNLFNEGGTSAIADNDRKLVSLKMTHVLGSRSFYELYFDYSYFRNIASPMAMRDTSTVINWIGDREYDETPAGYLKNPDYPPDAPGMFEMSIGSGTFDDSWTKGITAKFDFVSQLNKFNEFRFGIEFNTNTYHDERASISPAWTFETSPVRLEYDETSYYGAAYIEDKLEFEGMIATAGLRADYFNPNTKWIDWDADPFNEDYAASNFDPELGSPEEKQADTQFKLSPRLGISHPVTVNSKVYFNYGHFYQVLPPHNMYRSYFSTNAMTRLRFGNPFLAFPSTVAYELGFEQVVAGLFLFHIAGYYQDIKNEIRNYLVQDFDGSVYYETFVNDGYSDRRGIEVWLRREQGRFFTGWLNFDYQLISSGETGKAANYEDPNLEPYERRLAEQTKPYPQPNLNFTFDLHTPLSWGSWWGGWRAVTIFEWRAGSRWTYNPDRIPGLVNNIQNVDYSNTNFRLIKRFNLGWAMPYIYLEIRNLFNQKRLYTGHFYNNTEEESYLESLKLDFEPEGLKGNDRYGDWDKDYIKLGWMDYRRFLNPRMFRLGMRFEF